VMARLERADRFLLSDRRLQQSATGPARWRPSAITLYLRQATYDLRRLKRKELIAKVPHTNRYQLTDLGRRVAVLFTKTYGRILAPGLSALDPHLLEGVVAPSSLSSSWRYFEKALDDFMQAQLVAAKT